MATEVTKALFVRLEAKPGREHVDVIAETPPQRMTAETEPSVYAVTSEGLRDSPLPVSLSDVTT